MGKPKKGRKRDDDWEDDDVADEIAALSIENQKDSATASNGQIEEPKPKKKDKKKKSKKVVSDEEEDDIEAQEIQSTTGKGKSAAMSAFQMLAIDSDERGSSSSSGEEEVVPKPVTAKKKPKTKQEMSNEEDSLKMQEQEVPAPVQSKSKSKKKGKAEKPEKKEEDIDALLAEIEGPSRPDTGKGKKKKKGKAQEENIPETPAEMETAAAAEPTVPAAEPTVTAAKPTITAAGETDQTPGLEAMDVSTMTQEQIAAWLDDGAYEEDEKKKKKKKKAKKQEEQKKAAEEGDDEDKMDEGDEEDNEGGTVKSAAQKKKEKKERQKQQKLMEKTKQQKKSTQQDAGKAEVTDTAVQKIEEDAPVPAASASAADANNEEGEGEDDDKKKKKKDKKKKKKVEEEEEEKKKKPSKMAKQIQEMQKKIREEEERQIREEEEQQRLIEEKQRQKEEQEKKEKERKEREKQKKKDKLERLKAEGKYLTEKQKQEKQRAAQMLEALKAQGLALPDPGEKKKKVVYATKKKKKEQEIESPTETPTEEKDLDIKVEEEVKEEVKEEVTPEEKKDDVKDSWEDVKDSWDAESEEEPEKEDSEGEQDKEDQSEDEDDEDSDSEEESDEESSEEESEEEDEKLTPRERALARIQKRKDEADQKKSTDNLRAPVVCVLGHVDTGKTKILDKLRRTHVQDDEAGGITQQIGATNVPLDAIANQTKMCKEFSKQELKVPGLLIIDTPGHESFSNLRTRGSSLCDIAILVIDIMHGLEPQTIESINLLKKGKTPFIVALNKIDRLYQWQSNPHNDVVNTIKKQKSNTKVEFEERTQAVIVQLAEQGLNACLFNENKNVREYVSMVPTSAHSGDGMGNLLALVCELTQTLLAKHLSFSEDLQATVMEVKAIQGLGTTIDVILVNGSLHEGDTIIVAGQEGPIVTQIRALLMPQPMKELRVKNAYNKFKEVVAAQGCKIIAKDLEKALAGLPLYVAQKPDETEVYKEEISEALEDILGSIKLQERGVFVQASTLGSLEALLEFLRTSKIPYAGINIGPVHKKDIMKASIMLEHDTQWAVILAFDVKVEREAQEMADSVGVKIFTAEIIYHLFDRFTAHRDHLKKIKQEEFKHIAVFPCKLKILPQYIFNSRDPIVCGVIIQQGFLKEGTPLCVPTKESLDIGRVTSIENNHKVVSKATKGQEVCIKIEPIPGDAPKMFGRHFDESDLLVSKLTRQSIDAVKNYFRDDMTKGDWQLVMELKKTFEIL